MTLTLAYFAFKLNNPHIKGYLENTFNIYKFDYPYNLNEIDKIIKLITIDFDSLTIRLSQEIISVKERNKQSDKYNNFQKKNHHMICLLID